MPTPIIMELSFDDVYEMDVIVAIYRYMQQRDNPDRHPLSKDTALVSHLPIVCDTIMDYFMWVDNEVLEDDQPTSRTWHLLKLAARHYAKDHEVAIAQAKVQRGRQQ